MDSGLLSLHVPGKKYVVSLAMGNLALSTPSLMKSMIFTADKNKSYPH